MSKIRCTRCKYCNKNIDIKNLNRASIIMMVSWKREKKTYQISPIQFCQIRLPVVEYINDSLQPWTKCKWVIWYRIDTLLFSTWSRISLPFHKTSILPNLTLKQTLITSVYTLRAPRFREHELIWLRDKRRGNSIGFLQVNLSRPTTRGIQLATIDQMPVIQYNKDPLLFSAKARSSLAFLKNRSQLHSSRYLRHCYGCLCSSGTAVSWYKRSV